MERLLGLPDDELRGPRAAELEDAVQSGLAAVHLAELWVRHLTRALAASGDDPERAAALESEIAESRASVAEARRQVGELHARANRLGVGSLQR